MSQHIIVDQIIDPAPARVTVTRDNAGGVASASFDLTGLPRVDAMLTGRPTMEVPGLVERLCSICPGAHHLAGMRALESLAVLTDLPPTAVAVRRMLHYASIVSTHLVGIFQVFPEKALILRQFTKAVMTAVGAPGHFPAVAVPGGVVAPVNGELRDKCAAMVKDAIAVAFQIAEQTLAMPSLPDQFKGTDVALIDETGQIDLFGTRLRAISTDGWLAIDAARPAQWDDLVAEGVPGSSAPRPYLRSLGSARGAYRVGPMAQMRVGLLTTPLASILQQMWRESGGGASAARAIMVLHSIEAISRLLDAPVLTSGEPSRRFPKFLPATVGVGWVDSARGLLVHRYATTSDGHIAKATILTPTAQNEPWLGELLRTAAISGGGAVQASMEDAIREADPCLPCSSAPAGTMGLVVDTVARAEGS
ncbi:MAG: nickel-dependent hydrogenase large subunit [Propionibacteriaceae bacterium]|nr:nickel-dependent hydrogenase large subunit [Propionibacteriaceae bacterium]